MLAYTAKLRETLESISFEDDNFIEELLEVAQLFRPFSVAITEFISEHGFNGSREKFGSGLLPDSPSNVIRHFSSALRLDWMVAKLMSSLEDTMPGNVVSIAIRYRRLFTISA